MIVQLYPKGGNIKRYRRQQREVEATKKWSILASEMMRAKPRKEVCFSVGSPAEGWAPPLRPAPGRAMRVMVRIVSCKSRMALRA